MKSSLIASVTLSLAVSAVPIAGAGAQTPVEQTGANAHSPEITVTVDNFVRAASNRELGKYVALADGVNKFVHFREPTPIDNQPTIRTNRDTLYSTPIVDISEGVA